MAEAHPVGFQWVMEAKRRGATVIHVDPRFTRTSAVSDLHVPIRAGSDIAFLGGLVNHVLSNDLDFREYVVAYTNAATIVDESFQDTEDLDGLFSGFDPETGHYDPTSWRYEDERSEGEGRQPGQRHRHPRARGRAVRGARLGRRAGELEGLPRRDAAAPALRVPDPQAALRALHPGDGAAGHRDRAGAARAGRRRADPQQRARAHHRLLLRRRLDAPQRRRADDPHRLDPADPAGQHRPARRRHHGAARARQHPGVDGHPDAVQHPSRLPADAARGAAPQRRLLRRAGRGQDRLLGQQAVLLREPDEGLLRRRRDPRQRLLLRLPATADRRPLDVRHGEGADRGALQGLLPGGREPRRRLVERQDAAARHGQPRLARGARPADDRVGDLLEGRSRDRDR